jgi:hypothetical protein
VAGAEPKSHYDVLGVATKASHDEVRKAYLKAARKWHPDRHSGGTVAESARAEAEMRRVNQAWEVLGDREQRHAYDQRQAVRRRATTTASQPTTGIRTDDEGVTRIDPRLLNPEFLEARRQAQVEEIANRHGVAIRMAPLLAVVGMLVGIFVFTAYATRTGDATTSTTVPGPRLGPNIEAFDCVSITSGPALIEVPCTANANRVIGARFEDGTCQVGTTMEVTLSNGVIACLGPSS